MDAANTVWLVRWNDGGDAFDKLSFTGHVQTGDIPITTDDNRNIRLLRFDRADETALGTFENGMELLQAEMNPHTLQTHFVWRTTQPLSESFTVSALVLDAAGQVVAQLDSVPLIPTTDWTVDTPVWDSKQLVTTNGQPLPVGEYELAVQVYLWSPDEITAVLHEGGEAILRLEKFRISP
jgi:hypothetical protein